MEHFPSKLLIYFAAVVVKRLFYCAIKETFFSLISLEKGCKERLHDESKILDRMSSGRSRNEIEIVSRSTLSQPSKNGQ